MLDETPITSARETNFHRKNSHNIKSKNGTRSKEGDNHVILTPLHNINRQNVMTNKFIVGRLGENQPYKVFM